MTQSTLFSPLALGSLSLKNRLVMAPMTRSRAGADGVPSSLAAIYYAQRASAGLLVAEATQVSAEGIGYINTPGIYTEDQVAGWKIVTDAVHAAGGKIFLQLWHVGRVSHPDFHGGKLPVAPSAVGYAGEVFTPEGRKPTVTPRALALGEIKDIVEQFHRGAANAKAAGFDGVEIHGANGYLPDQFLQSGSNQRTDEYGGSVERRARFLLEITRAAVGVWGPGRVGVRLSPSGGANGISDKEPVATFSHVIQALNEFDLAYVHLMRGAPNPELPDVVGTLAPLVRSAVIANGGYTKETAAAALASGKVALVSFGVPFIANPDLTERFRQGADLAAPDRATMYGGDARGYTDYPALTGS